MYEGLYNESRKNSMLKYQATLSQISIKVKPEIKEQWQHIAESRGQSLRAFILESIEKNS